MQLFSLLAANPSLLRLIADIMGTAPRLARIIGRRPRLLDAVLDPGFFGAVPTAAKLKELVGAALAEARDYQEALDRARIVGREQAFLIGVRVISGTLSARQAGAAYAGLAETLDRGARRAGRGRARPQPRAPCREAEAAVHRHGQARRAREMTAGSDLDLIVVYDYEGEGAQSDRGQEPARSAILFALHSAPDRGALGRDRRGLALSGGYAAQALGQSGPGRDQGFRASSPIRRLSLDLGASCADPRARRHRLRRAAAADQRHDQGGAVRARATAPPWRQTSGPCAPRSPTTRAARISGT